MFEFQWMVLLLLLPLPWLIRKWIKPARALSASALKVPSLDDFGQIIRQSRKYLKQLLRVLLWLSWLLLVLAVARPIWVGEPVNLAQSTRNIILAVDLSGSMEQRDFSVGGTRVSRLAATKKVASDFIDRREGDRIGLILFGDNAYLQAPLTLDRDTVKRLLNEAVLGLAGERTAIGDAIALAVKRTLQHPDQEYVMVLMTDGAATAGVNVEEASKLAAEAGLKIYTVGIGSVARRSFFGGGSDLDEPALKAIAQMTGGAYFRARNTKEFEAIYNKLDELEPIENEEQLWRPRHDLFYWPLAFSMLFLLLAFILKMRFANE